MSKLPKSSGSGRQRSSASTAPSPLYDSHGPIPVADAHESDTESVWALFQESVLQANEQQPSFEETKLDDTVLGGLGETPPGGQEPPFDETVAAPLKP